MDDVSKEDPANTGAIDMAAGIANHRGIRKPDAIFIVIMSRVYPIGRPLTTRNAKDRKARRRYLSACGGGMDANGGLNFVNLRAFVVKTWLNAVAQDGSTIAAKEHGMTKHTVWIALSILFAFFPCSQAAPAPRPLETLYPGLQSIRAATNDLVCLIDTEHPDEVRRQIGDRAPRYHWLERVRLCIELEVAGLPCFIAHASMLSPEDLARPTVKAVVVYGRNKRTSASDDARLFSLMRECRAPMLCLGGAMGLMVTAHGGKSGNMRPLEPGEKDPDPSYAPGFFKELGFTAVRVFEPDPIFKGVDDPFIVMERHTSEVKELPAEFKMLASTDACRVQACRHRQKLIYGLQFAADRFDETHTHGMRILQNFFDSAGIDTKNRLHAAREAFRDSVRPLVRGVCEDPSSMREMSGPFVAVIDMESADIVAGGERRTTTTVSHAEKIARLRRRIEGEVAGLPCVILHYTEVRQEDFSHPGMRAILITGAASPTVGPMTRELSAIIRDARLPILGLCAGHQHIAKAHGIGSSSMRKLREGEKDPNPNYHPGLFKEWSFLPIRVLRRDPLFEGLPDTIVAQEYHVAEVKSVPDGFDVLAGTDECEIQALKRRDRPVYGTQFHAENYDDAHPDGRRILQNFFRIAAEAQGDSRARP